MAALFLQSVRRAYEIDPGFQTAHLAVFVTNPGQAAYTKPQATAFYQEVRERVSEVPGVESVSWASNMPLWASPATGLQVEGWQARSQADTIRAVVNTVDRGYFQTAGVGIRSGREFTDLDQENSAPVAIVNEKMEQDYWPAGAIGRRIQLPGEKRMRQIVGVAKTANYSNWGESPQLCVYVPLAQSESDSLVLYVRSERDPQEILNPVEREIRGAGPQVLMSGRRTGSQIIDGGLFQVRMGVALLSVFGLLALVLASIGLYGIQAYSVTQRKREIGLRMAVGAGRASVLRLILQQGMSLVLTGVLIGFVATLFVGRLLSTMLYGVSPSDPLSIAVAAGVLLAVALLACYLPARRATRIDPIIALREG
jgi:predicted permease